MKTLLFTAMAASAALTFSAPSLAGEHGRYRDHQDRIAWTSPYSAAVPPHHLVAHEDYIQYLTPEQILELNEYLDYAHREPCQHYREPPTNFYWEGCKLKYRYPQPVAQQQPAPVVAPVPVKKDVLMSYAVNFDFDRAVVDSEAMAVLDRVAREITTYNPGEVTVSGHADRAGAEGYNDRLSGKRASAVSAALTARGVEHRVIDQKAFGESDPAVETGDGVALRDNRRVVVEFLK